MEIRRLEVDFDSGILKINGKDFTHEPIIVTLPGSEGWPLARLFNVELSTGDPKECIELSVSWAETNNKP